MVRPAGSAVAMSVEPDARPVAGGESRALLRAAHIGPALAVTVLTGLLCAADDLPVETAVLVVAAVLSGQLTIGWGNDLIDAPRDRRVGRADKPIATGALAPRTVAVSLAVAAVGCVALSAAAGWRSGLVNVALVVGSGQAYNLGLKATAWSWAPYAVAFGSLPAVASLAGPDRSWPPLLICAAAAALGVAAHFLNALPDLDSDLSVGVRGLPQRLGASRSREVAAAVLVAASAAAALGRSGGVSSPWSWAGLVVVLALAVVALSAEGKTPFRAAVAIAVVDVLLLLGAS
jgi:4-hydroxybenzoate polyprenyltransferase